MKSISVRLKRATGHSAGAWLLSLLVLAFILVQLTPLYFMISNSIKTKEAYLQNAYNLPAHAYFGNYAKIITEFDFPRMFSNSFFLTIVSVLICGYLGALAAFAAGKFNFRGRSLVNIMILPLMSIPGVVLLIPLFVFFSKLHMIDSLWTVALIYIGLILPFTVNILSSFMSSVPNSLIEASLMDGCGFFRTFNRIVFPLVAPGFSAAAIVNAMWIWNELLIVSVFTQSDAKRTLILGLISLQGRFSVDIPLLMAGAAVSSIPIILLYLLSQKWFIRGLVVGGEK